MEAIILFGLIAFVAGLVARSLFVTPRPPQVIYVQTEPVERGSGCLPFILASTLLLGLLLVVVGG